MGYKVNMKYLSVLQTNISNFCNNFSEPLGNMFNDFSKIQGSSFIEGEYADNIKAYVLCTHMVIIQQFIDILSSHHMFCNAYYVEYKEKVDDDYGAYIEEDILNDIRSTLWDAISAAEWLGSREKNNNSIPSILDGIKNDMPHGIQYPNIDLVLSHLRSSREFVGDLYSNINTIEWEHKNNDFKETKKAIDSLDSLIDSLLSESRASIIDFDPVTFLESEESKNAVEANSLLNEEFVRRSVDFQDTYNKLLKYNEADKNKREQEGEVFMTCIGLTCAILGFFSAGTVSAAASAALLAFAEEWKEQYVDGDVTNWEKCMAVAGISALATTCTGGLGGQLSSLSNSIKDYGLCISAKAFIDVTSKASERYINEYGKGKLEGKGHEEANKDAINEATDPMKLGWDAVWGGAKGLGRGDHDNGLDSAKSAFESLFSENKTSEEARISGNGIGEGGFGGGGGGGK